MLDTIVESLKHANADGTISEEMLKSALDKHNSEAVVSSVDCIQKHYNICILNELCNNSDRDTFDDALSSLNTVLSIVAPSDRPSVISLFDRVAELNFRTHRYEDTITLLNKAILLEAGIGKNEPSALNVEAQFRRRWLLATCLEYLGLILIENKDKVEGEKKIKSAIKLLVGNRVLLEDYHETSTDEKNTNCSAISQKPIIQSDQNNPHKNEKRSYDRAQLVQSIIDITSASNPVLMLSTGKKEEIGRINEDETIDIPEVDWTEPCLALTIEKWFKLGRLSKELYTKMLNDVSHIAAHCLSELERDITAKKRQFPAFMRFRFADFLMKQIGPDYVTCLATLSFERGEHFGAINILKMARQDNITSLELTLWEAGISAFYLEVAFSSDYDGQIDKKWVACTVENIALIDFYLWYFSVIANLSDYSTYKSEFKHFCEKSGDVTALTYYYTLNFKEHLITGFNILSKANFSPRAAIYREQLKSITNAYKMFTKYAPKQRIHHSIWDEWIFLNKTYQLFLKLLPIYNKPQNADYQTFKIIQMLASPGKVTITNEALIKSACYFRATSSTGSFSYFGNHKVIKQLGNWCSIDFVLSPVIDDPLFERLWTYPFKETSNILVRVDEHNLGACVSFIKTIIEKDTDLVQSERHSIFVDYSELSNSSQIACEQECGDLMSIENIHFFRHPTEAFLLCVMFSKIEKTLKDLQTPLDSYMISPTSRDVTYVEQYGEDPLSVNHLLSTKDLVDISSWTLDEPKDIIGACLPVQDSQKPIGAKLDLKLFSQIVNDCSSISHLFVFDAPKDGEKVSDCLFAYCFDISSHLRAGANAIFSDTYYVLDKRRDLQTSLQRLSRLSKHGATCGSKYCISHFTSFELYKQNDENEAQSLKEYLYSYIGVLMDESCFLLFQHYPSPTKIRYYLCVLPNSDYNNMTELICSYCRALKNCKTLVDTDVVIGNTTEYESLLSLKNRIQRLDKRKKYFFISYRAKGGLRKLCEPVYRDVLYLQERYPQFGFCIDNRNFGDLPNDEMLDFIDNPKCIGAIVYMTPEYFLPESNGKRAPHETDACFKEAEHILKKGNAFRVFPVFLSNTLSGTQYERNPSGYIEHALTTLQHEKDARFQVYHDLLGCKKFLDPERTVLEWQQFGHHFERQEKGRSDNFVNVMEELINQKQLHKRKKEE